MVGLVVSHQLDRFEVLPVHSPRRGAVGEHHAPLVRKSRIAEVGWLAGNEVREDAGGDVDEIGFAIRHETVVVDQGEGQAGHDPGVAAHATGGRDGIGLVLGHEVLEEAFQEKCLRDRVLGRAQRNVRRLQISLGLRGALGH